MDGNAKDQEAVMPHILRCDHYHVCWMLRFRNNCKNDGQPKPVCMFDTRLHSNASDRDKMLDLLEKIPAYPSDLGDMVLLSDIEAELRTAVKEQE